MTLLIWKGKMKKKKSNTQMVLWRGSIKDTGRLVPIGQTGKNNSYKPWINIKNNYLKTMVTKADWNWRKKGIELVSFAAFCLNASQIASSRTAKILVETYNSNGLRARSDSSGKPRQMGNSYRDQRKERYRENP